MPFALPLSAHRLRLAQVAVGPLQPVQIQLPPSPYAFFAENDVLRIWLRSLNALLTAYCAAMVTLLTPDGSCSGMRSSFYCNPDTGTSRFAFMLRNIHAGMAVYLGFCAWQLRFPRRCFVLMNITVIAVWGLALFALGITQCAVAKQSVHPVTTTAVGFQLMILGLVATIGGGYGGWRYHRRRTIELVVIVDALWES